MAINKTAAEDALSRIPYIIRTIDNANTMTDRAENQLGNALAIAKDAKGKAELADTIANNIQKVLFS